MPNRVRITTSCCQINCGGQGDIAVNVQYTKPPKINHDLVANVCERPAVVARCPVAAIRPAMVNGKPSLEVDERKCVCCGACYPPCPPMQINGDDSTKIAIWVGGKHSNARSKPTFHKLAVANLPNNAPHWPEVKEAVGKIINAYKRDAKHWERMGEWIERIGWPAFFEKDRTRLYQASPRYLDRRPLHHEPFGTCPFLRPEIREDRSSSQRRAVYARGSGYRLQLCQGGAGRRARGAARVLLP
ncbi:hypothetical protein ACFOHS_00225 [Jhaorihella thermophila]